MAQAVNKMAASRAARNNGGAHGSPSWKQGKKHVQTTDTFVVFVKLAPAHQARASWFNVSRMIAGRRVRRNREKPLDVSGASRAAGFWCGGDGFGCFVVVGDPRRLYRRAAHVFLALCRGSGRLMKTKSYRLAPLPSLPLRWNCPRIAFRCGNLPLYVGQLAFEPGDFPFGG